MWGGQAHTWEPGWTIGDTKTWLCRLQGKELLIKFPNKTMPHKGTIKRYSRGKHYIEYEDGLDNEWLDLSQPSKNWKLCGIIGNL